MNTKGFYLLLYSIALRTLLAVTPRSRFIMLDIVEPRQCFWRLAGQKDMTVMIHFVTYKWRHTFTVMK